MNGDHPVRLLVTDDLRRSRLTVFFRLLLAIPHIVWLVLWTIAVAVAAIVGWVAAVFAGRLPAALHRFFAAYIRYVIHVSAYVGIVANPFPGFTGDRGYPIDVSLPEPQRQARWRIALRLLLALPALILAAALGWGTGGGGGGAAGDGPEDQWLLGIGGVAAVCAILGWFAALAVGRMPPGLRNLAAYGLGYAAQTYAYTLLLTERYPNADPESPGPQWALPPHQVALQLDDDGRRSRLTVFFRLLLALPHIVWLVLWSFVALLAGFVNAIVALLAGRSAAALHRFLSAYVRYGAHVSAFLFLVANPFPGFTGAPGYPVDIAIGERARQNRWVTFFRVVLAIPALFVAGALAGALAVVAFLGWFAALVTGRMPAGLRNLGAVCVRYLAQVNAYWLIVTDRYPHASPAVRPPPPREPADEPGGDADAEAVA